MTSALIPSGWVQVGSAVVTRGTDSRLALGRLGALAEQIEALMTLMDSV